MWSKAFWPNCSKNHSLTFLVGWMIVSNEIAQGVLGLAVSFWGGRGHRPGWIATCAAIHALTCFLLFLPHLVHGTYPDHGHGTGTYDGGKFTDRHQQCSVHQPMTL